MKMIEIIAAADCADTVSGIAEQQEARDFRLGYQGEDGRQAMRMLVADDHVQPVLDALQQLLGTQPEARIVVLPVDAVLPKPAPAEDSDEKASVASREALYSAVSKSARVDVNFIVLVTLSTIVAAIGLIEDNVAVVIGAMVIAPLLGPNLALGLGAALGDIDLITKAMRASAVGVAVALSISIAIGALWPYELVSDELLSRCAAGLDSAALALASGAAAALSITTGLPSVLVGVMVAVALLPPTATAGIMLGQGELELALGATLLLAVNIVCVNLAAKVVFLLKGIRPRTWYERARARRAMTVYILVWFISLVVLLFVIVHRYGNG